jgi:hypothetical protein
MSDTPETDALRKSIDNGADAEAEMTLFAGKLERERYEAREALREAWLAMDEFDGTDRMTEWQNKYANILEETK